MCCQNSFGIPPPLVSIIPMRSSKWGLAMSCTVSSFIRASAADQNALQSSSDVGVIAHIFPFTHEMTVAISIETEYQHWARHSGSSTTSPASKRGCSRTRPMLRGTRHVGSALHKQRLPADEWAGAFRAATPRIQSGAPGGRGSVAVAHPPPELPPAPLGGEGEWNLYAVAHERHSRTSRPTSGLMYGG